MKDVNAARILADVMGWVDEEILIHHLSLLQILAYYKYDKYQQYGLRKRFVESLALWLAQFDFEDRAEALKFVEEKLIFVSEEELLHLVQSAYPDVIVQERLHIVAEELSIPDYRVAQLSSHPRFKELQIKSLYLGLSDGAHTNDLRRASNGAIGNEQIWQAYELGDAKATDMLGELSKNLKTSDFDHENSKFNIVWLVDDFSGSGNTYIRYDAASKSFKGKIKKVYERIYDGDIVDHNYYEIYLLLYSATKQAIDHIEYWSERFALERGFKPLQLRVLSPLEPNVSLLRSGHSDLIKLLEKPKYYDERASDKHVAIGGTDARFGFAGCALPLVLSHNTPNNSIYALWPYWVASATMAAVRAASSSGRVGTLRCVDRCWPRTRHARRSGTPSSATT